MDPILIAALVGGLCTILSPLLVLYLKGRKNQSEIPAVDVGRLEAICGSWTGTGIAEETENHGIIDFQISCQINRKGKIFNGFGAYKSEITEFNHQYYDGSYDGRYFKILFKNSNPSAYQRGYVIMVLNDIGNVLEGKYLCNGITSSEIISGSLKMEKQI